MTDLTHISWDQFPSDVQPRDRVARNFRFYELTRSEIAERLMIDNTFPTIVELRAAIYLCRRILQPVRDEFGSYTPNSVFRSQELERVLKNKRADWASKSQHTKGQACDIEIPGVPTMELSRWVSEHLDFDQVICECYNIAQGANSGWLHVSLVPPGMGHNRMSILSYVIDPLKGKYVYVNGLKESPQ